jgi:hypothetical protein
MERGAIWDDPLPAEVAGYQKHRVTNLKKPGAARVNKIRTGAPGTRNGDQTTRRTNHAPPLNSAGKGSTLPIFVNASPPVFRVSDNPSNRTSVRIKTAMKTLIMTLLQCCRRL